MTIHLLLAPFREITTESITFHAPCCTTVNKQRLAFVRCSQLPSDDAQVGPSREAFNGSIISRRMAFMRLYTSLIAVFKSFCGSNSRSFQRNTSSTFPCSEPVTIIENTNWRGSIALRRARASALPRIKFSLLACVNYQNRWTVLVSRSFRPVTFNTLPGRKA